MRNFHLNIFSIEDEIYFFHVILRLSILFHIFRNIKILRKKMIELFRTDLFLRKVFQAFKAF